ncbi:hypothetical protein FACS1894106_1460 [Spirochaetia bacterium]|nr:hypothetical protein FACS1894106_1460 [Spirochaetia bacterium]
MKRSEALTLIKWYGWHDDRQRAMLIAEQKGIGKAAYRKAFLDGQKAKEREEPCGCPKCSKGAE